MQELAIFLIFTLEGIIGIALLLAWREARARTTALPNVGQETYEELEKVMTNTLNQSAEILDQAHKKYTKLSSGIETITTSFMDESRQMREKFGSLENSLFKVGQTELESEINDIGKEATALLKSQINSQTQNLSTELQQMVGELKSSLRQELSAVLEASRQEIRQETNRKLEELANQSESLVVEVAGQLLQEGLSMQERHALTLNLLKDAWGKRQGKIGEAGVAAPVVPTAPAEAAEAKPPATPTKS